MNEREATDELLTEALLRTARAGHELQSSVGLRKIIERLRGHAAEALPALLSTPATDIDRVRHLQTIINRYLDLINEVGRCIDEGTGAEETILTREL